MKTLPKSRLNTFAWKIVPFSIVGGIIDIGIVALSSRLAGSLVGKELNDFLPGVNVFNNSIEEQAIILVCLFVILSWLGSFTKIFRLMLIESLTAQIWRDISNGILFKLIGQPYNYFLTTKSSSISSQILANMQNIADLIIRPILLMITSIILICSVSLAFFYFLPIFF